MTRNDKITQAVKDRDLMTLKQLARTQGFLTLRHRQQAWPLLLNFRSLYDPANWHPTQPHPDESQLHLDLPRTQPFQASKNIKRQRRQLGRVVASVLRCYRWLGYYQGFHELCLVFLSVFGSELPAIEASKMVALFMVRDAMSSNLDHVLQQLQLLYTLLGIISPSVHRLLTGLEVPPFFAVSWVLTWFAHDLTDFRVICRIYDFLIASPPLQVVVMAAAIIKHLEQIILELEDPDFATLHSELSKLPQRVTDWDSVIEHSHRLMVDYPATRLQHMGKCHLPRLSAVNTYQATWTKLDPVRPQMFSKLIATNKTLHPLAGSITEKSNNRMAKIMELTGTAQKARDLALQHRWSLMMAAMASATMFMYVWLFVNQPLGPH